MFAKVATLTGLLCLSAMAGSGVANAAMPTGANDSSHISGPALPAALRPVFYQSLAHDADFAYAVNKDGCATLPKGTLKACFDEDGVSFSGASKKPLALHLTAWGRGDALLDVKTVNPIIADSRVSYAHRALTEWWRILPTSFEQGFTISKRPVGNGALTLALATNNKATIDHGELAFCNLRYGDLVVTDATGKTLPASMTTKHKRILIAVNDTNAIYPVTIDPLVWIEQQKLIANDGAAIDHAGSSVALFGKTALLGAPFAQLSEYYNRGAVYIFSDSAGVWSEQQKLWASDGESNDQFGSSVALSDTAILVGAPYATVDGNAIEGAAYVFTKSGDTWNQTQKLVPDDGAADDFFGYSVSLYGSTAIVTAIGVNSFQGAAYIFTESDGTWSEVQKLTANDGAAVNYFGQSAALDNDTAAIGAYGATIRGNSDQGATYIFTKSDGMWSQVQKLTASDGATGDFFGNSVALDHNTAAIGAFDATIDGNFRQGAVYIFAKANGVWEQIQKLTASDGARKDYFGRSVTLSGTALLVGASGATVDSNKSQGAAYEFTKSAKSWNQAQKLTASDGTTDTEFGTAVALVGTTALVGAPLTTIGENTGQGAAYIYTPICPQGYGAHNGRLNASGLYGSPPYQAPVGRENAILGAPSGFSLYAQYSNNGSPHTYRIPSNEIHKRGPAGTYRWGVKAGSSGGAYTLCILHP